MLVLRPELVEFNGMEWPGVELIAVERTAGREVVEFGDRGPYVAFVDVPERRVTVRVQRSPGPGFGVEAAVGAEVVLVFEAAPGRADSGRTRVTVSGVVMRVGYETTPKGVKQVVSVVGVSPDGGVSDPVTVQLV
jgi:hypothetical protein